MLSYLNPELLRVVHSRPLASVSVSGDRYDAAAPERHDLQYFEMFGNRGVYYKGWSAVTKHRTPWEMVQAKLRAFDDDIWELYDGSRDWSQAHDLAGEMPGKLHELQRLWLIEAVKYNVLPIDDRTAERIDPGLAGRRS
jgi:arylsulfatase A-like enzyme